MNFLIEGEDVQVHVDVERLTLIVGVPNQERNAARLLAVEKNLVRAHYDGIGDVRISQRNAFDDGGRGNQERAPCKQVQILRGLSGLRRSLVLLGWIGGKRTRCAPCRHERGIGG